MRRGTRRKAASKCHGQSRGRRLRLRRDSGELHVGGFRRPVELKEATRELDGFLHDKPVASRPDRYNVNQSSV